MESAPRRAGDLVGDRLGDYELVKVLGRGGQGVVYLARQPSLEREVVIKVLERDDAEALVREARLAARLDHPFAAHVYDHGVDPRSGRPWVAMERVRGTPLDKILAFSGPPPIARAIALLERLAQVIDAAHAAGIAHGDIKPSNVVVLTEGGRPLPKLIDFGLARSLDDRRGSTSGSPAYQAPERWAGSPPDRASDVYSLAALAFELLSGHPPFAADSVTALRRAHESEPVPAIGGGLPVEVDAAFARALAKDPRHRTESAGALAAALRQATVGGGAESLVLPASLHADLIAAAPQPIAACFAAAVAAIGPHAQTAALRRGAAAVCHYLGLLALASAPPASWGESPLVRELGSRCLAPAEWLALARELTSAADVDLHPLPDLIRALAGSEVDAIADFAATAGVADADREREVGRAGIEALAAMPLPLGNYRIAALSDSGLEGWSGPSPGPRIASPAPSPLPAEVSLLDRDGAPICALSPLIIRERPSPRHGEQLFLFAGAGPRGLRAIAPAAGFEIGAEPVRAWLAGALAERDRAAAPERPPFVGLASYGTGDADLFVGRERELDDALNHLRAEPLLAIAGPSGVGKSSLARAGIAAAWPGPVTIARPGELASTAIDPDALLVVDQLEELFTLEIDPSVAALIAGHPGRVVVTIRDDFLGAARQLPRLGSRIARGLLLLAPPRPADLERIAREPLERVGYRWADPQMPAEIAAAVAGEAGALALISFFCRELWQRRDRVSRVIDRDAYQALGGVRGALARHADAVLAAAPPRERAAIRRLLLALITAAGSRRRRPVTDVLAAAGELGPAALDRLIRGRLVVSSESESGAEAIEIVHESLIDGWPALRRWRADAQAHVLLREQIEEAASRWAERDRPPGMLWSGDAVIDVRRLLTSPEPGLSDRARRFARSSVDAAVRRRRRRLGALAIAVASLAAAAVVFFVLARRAERARIAEGAERARAETRLAQLLRERGRVEMIAGEPDRALRLFHGALAVAPDDPGSRFLVARAIGGVDALVGAIPIGAPIGGVAFHDTGDRIAVQTASSIAVHDRNSGAERARHGASTPWIRPRWIDGDTVAFNRRGGGLGLWSPETDRFEPLPLRDRAVQELGVRGAYILVRDGDGATAMFRRGEPLWSAGELGQSDAGFYAHDRVALAEEGKVTLRDAGSGAVIATLAEGEGYRKIAAGRGRILVIRAGELALFDESGVERWRHSRSDSLRMPRIAGRVIAVVADRHEVELIEADSGATRARIASHGSPVTGLEISASGLLAVARADGRLELYRTRTGAPVGRLLGHFGPIRSIAFDPSGEHLISGGDDGVARIWQVATAIGERRIRGRLTPGSRFDPAGRRLAVRGAIVDLESGERVETPAGHRLLSSRWAGDQARLLMARDRRAAIEPGGVAIEAADEIRAGDLSPAGDRAAVIDRAGTLALFGGGPEVAIAAGDHGAARSVRWLSDAALLVTHDRALVLRAPKDGEERSVLANGRADAVAVAGDRIAAAFDRRLAVYRIDGAELASIELPRLIEAVAIAGDQLVACTDDGELIRFAADTGERLADVAAHPDDCSALAFVGDKLIASAGRDRRLRIWSADRLELLAERDGVVSSPALVVSEAGDRLAATSLEGAAIWDVDLYRGSAADLAAALECRIAVDLIDGRFFRQARPPARCAARLAPKAPDRAGK